MKVLSASIFLLMSVYFLSLPIWIVQVLGATVASLGFIMFASILFGEKSKRSVQLITQSDHNNINEINSDYRTDLIETHAQIDVQASFKVDRSQGLEARKG